MRRVKHILVTTGLLGAFTLAGTGCESNAQNGALIGGAGGAGAGAIIGSMVHSSSGAGALIGGAAGAIGGYMIGNEMDKQQDRARYQPYYQPPYQYQAPPPPAYPPPPPPPPSYERRTYENQQNPDGSGTETYTYERTDQR